MRTHCLKCQKPIGDGHTKYGLHVDCFVTWFKASSTAEFISLRQENSSSQNPANRPSKNSAHNTSFFHGMFKKYSADLGGASFILKMRQDNAPELPEVEYVCNQIGNTLGIPVAEHFIIDFFGDLVFVTRNFIKKGGTSSTLDHIYKYLREDQEYDCETVIHIIAEQTKRPFYVETFIQTTLFDALVGNHDRHGRNLGFIVTPSVVVLSPIYDNVSYVGLEHGPMLKADFNPAGKIGTQANPKEPGMNDYVIEFARLGYEDATKSFYQRTHLPRIHELIDRSLCSDPMKDALKRLIMKRFKELENALA